MQSIGRNDTTSVPGLCTPTRATIRPSVAAMLYAGAVEETAITTLESSPSAPARRPLSWPAAPWAWAGAAGAGVTAGAVISALTRVVMGVYRLPPGRLPGHGSTVSQYHIVVQVSDTKFFSLPSGLPVALAGAVPVVARAVPVARPSAGLAGAGAPRHREHAEQRGQRDGHGDEVGRGEVAQRVQ